MTIESKPSTISKKELGKLMIVREKFGKTFGRYKVFHTSLNPMIAGKVCMNNRGREMIEENLEIN
jgi:hypothetical protein